MLFIQSTDDGMWFIFIIYNGGIQLLLVTSMVNSRRREVKQVWKELFVGRLPMKQ